MGNIPLSIDLFRVSSEVKSHNIPNKHMISALTSLGYSLVQTYYNPSLWKTDAPFAVLYDIMKIWKLDHLDGSQTLLTNVKTGTAAY
jgi:tRNA G26 N,N-dimethylase Trm1